MRSLWLIILCLLVGCATTKRWTSEAKVKLYLATNPNVTEEVRQGLYSKSPVKGMNKEEARLCFGEPMKIEYSESGAKERETWLYFERDKEHSTIVNAGTPLTTLVFTNSTRGPILAGWQLRRKQTAPATVQPQPQAPAVEIVSSETDAVTSAAPKAQPQTVAASEPIPAGIPADWPALTLEAIVKRGGKSLALINDELVEAGSMVSGVKVLGISVDGVIVEYQGSKRLLAKENK